MDHYLAGVPKKPKSVVSFFEKLGGSTFTEILRSSVYESQDEQEPIPMIEKIRIFPKWLKIVVLILEFLAVVLILSNIRFNEVRILGSAIVSFVLGPILLLHVYIWRSYKPALVKMLLLLVLALLYYVLVFGALLLIVGCDEKINVFPVLNTCDTETSGSGSL